jgi:hypothetical protein
MCLSGDMVARPTVDKLHYLKTEFPNKAALRCCKSANSIRLVVAGPVGGSHSRYGTLVNVELRRNFAMVNDLSFEMQHSLFELRWKAHHVSRINCEIHIVT